MDEIQVTLIGHPNAGKSSLFTRMTGVGVIVSNYAGTTVEFEEATVTRNGVVVHVHDLPGTHSLSGSSDDERMVIKALTKDVGDVAVVVADASNIEGSIVLCFEVMELGIPVILALNKIDALPRKEDMMEKIASFSAIHNFEEIVPISAKTGDGVQLLLTQLDRFAAEAPHYFDEDCYTEQPERVIVSELIREKLLLLLRDEIPHGIAIVVEKMSERDAADITDIDAMIYCEKASHKGIIIGKNGDTLKRVASGARASIERFLQCRVNLQIWVKVSLDWRNRDGRLREFGFM